MSRLNALLERMASLIGISSSYTDAFGQSVETTPETRQALLAGLGLGVATEREAQESLERLERLKTGVIPSVIPVEANQPAKIRLRGTPGQAGGGLTWQVTEESGSVHEGRLAKGGSTLDLPPLAMGYHRLRVGETEATLIAAPDRCWEPEALRQKTRLWGATAQIYSLRSERDFGIGD